MYNTYNVRWVVVTAVPMIAGKYSLTTTKHMDSY